MTEFKCSVCNYQASLKGHVTRHINKKITCGAGIKEIIEIPVEIICEYCNKIFASKHNLKVHLKDRCKQKNRVKDDEIKRLKEELKNTKSTVINNTTNNDNSVNSTTNNITNIIIVNNYEDTSLEKLTDKEFNKLIKNSEEAYKIIPNLIKQLHFNGEIPENHNVYLSNKSRNNKHLSVFRNGYWEITDKESEINNIISDKETNLSDWVAEKGEKYPDAKERYNEYLDQKFDDDTIKLVKDEVEQVLYNGKHLVKKN